MERMSAGARVHSVAYPTPYPTATSRWRIGTDPLDLHLDTSPYTRGAHDRINFRVRDRDGKRFLQPRSDIPHAVSIRD